MTPYALGVTIGALMWNGLFLLAAALGVISGETAWFLIRVVLVAAASFVWIALILGIGASHE